MSAALFPKKKRASISYLVKDIPFDIWLKFKSKITKDMTINQFFQDLIKKVAEKENIENIAIYYRTHKTPEKCPKCQSKEVIACPGGTCLKLEKGIHWICKKCLWEW